MAQDGQIVAELDRGALERVLDTLDDDIEGFAVCLLNAHVDPRHERAVAAAIEARWPDRPCSCSTELWPEIREYERATVAVLNAYVQPILARYVGRLNADAAAIGLDTRLYITRSNGGVMSADRARLQPVATLLSGPASGVVGAAYIARLAGVHSAVTIDIGGTSADVSIIRDGEPAHSTEAMVGEFPVVAPSVDVFAVGAGGGSIAWFDQLGLLKLGPRSAGADPGPACYGLGGTEPTTTDAYIVCGYLNPGNFVGGAMPDLIPACGAGYMAPMVFAQPNLEEGGLKVIVLEPMTGGTGACSEADGFDARDVVDLANLRNNPLEIVESRASVLIREYALATDSGGVGRFRGGCGCILELEVLVPDCVLIARGQERHRFHRCQLAQSAVGRGYGVGAPVAGGDRTDHRRRCH